MAKLLATIKAIITRLIFSCHGLIAIWQVTQYKKDPIYWTLCAPIGLLFFEGFFTLAIKKTQEWRWFCPSVFLYLSSVVPAIWLLELDKLERRHKIQEETFSLVEATGDLKNLDKLLGLGVNIKIPNLQIDKETWIMLIEQFLMLILIIGRWLLPKGDLTRDQLSQLLLVYIGTAADIIEFFDSFKDNKIASEPILVFLTLGIWSWSLLQFTIVLTATRSRKPRGTTANSHLDDEDDATTCCTDCCCSIDVWGIALNILLQDAPFLTFRLLIIIHYQIISYMNVFFTCKNTLVILLQLYRLYVVQAENKKSHSRKKIDRNYEKHIQKSSKGRKHNYSNNEIYIISNEKYERPRDKNRNKSSRNKPIKKDTGYSTASTEEHRKRREKDKDDSRRPKEREREKEKRKSRRDESPKKTHKKGKRSKRENSSSSESEEKTRKYAKRECRIEEESDTTEQYSAAEPSVKKKTAKKRQSSSDSASSSSSS